MVFCHKCGEELPEHAYFCPRCGVRTGKGIEEGISIPRDELREGLSKIGQEIEKAFSIAAREIEEAFKTARESIRESTQRKTSVCPHCGEQNPGYARFCYKCGKALEEN